jgi:hypothetical protein
MPMAIESSHLFKILQVPSCFLAAIVATAVTTGSSLLSLWGTEPPPKKTHLGTFLRVSSRCVCGVICCLCGFHLPYFHRKTQKLISGWQESYLGNSHRSSIGCGLDDTPAPDPSDAIGCEHGQSYKGPLSSSRLAVVHQEALVLGQSVEET